MSPHIAARLAVEALRDHLRAWLHEHALHRHEAARGGGRWPTDDHPPWPVYYRRSAWDGPAVRVPGIGWAWAELDVSAGARWAAWTSPDRPTDWDRWLSALTLARPLPVDGPDLHAAQLDSLDLMRRAMALRAEGERLMERRERARLERLEAEEAALMVAAIARPPAEEQ